MKELILRAHHGMCLAFFEGKGYDDTFVAHMERIKMDMMQNPFLRIVARGDSICKQCPHLKLGVCEQAEQTAEYDHKVLTYCGISENAVMTWKEFSLLVQKQILCKGKRKEICGLCRWSYLCSEKEKTYILS